MKSFVIIYIVYYYVIVFFFFLFIDGYAESLRLGVLEFEVPGLGEKASPQWSLREAYAPVHETPMATQPGDEILLDVSTFEVSAFKSNQIHST